MTSFLFVIAVLDATVSYVNADCPVTPGNDNKKQVRELQWKVRWVMARKSMPENYSLCLAVPVLCFFVIIGLLLAMFANQIRAAISSTCHCRVKRGNPDIILLSFQLLLFKHAD